MPKPKRDVTPDQIRDNHIAKSSVKNGQNMKRPTYWLATKSDWVRSNKDEYNAYMDKKRKKKIPRKTSNRVSKVKRPSATSSIKSAIGNKKGKPTLTLNWTIHANFSKFERFFDSTTQNKFQKLSVDEKIKHQGWYCLGTTKLLAYVGMVGQWSNKSMSNNTIYHRWKNEHDDKGKKWPKGMFQNDDLAIDGDKAKIHTCTISSAITNKEMESRNPPLLNRNKSQYRLISMIEDALIFLPAQEHRIDEGSLYERNRGSLYQRNKNLDFINSNKGGKPIVIKEKKAMINNQSFNTFPKDQWYLSGDFNIKCKGKIPSQLSSFFSNGVHVNTFMNKLSKDKIR